ncbi:trifunctional dihydropteroate synthetase [Dispira parvispora]|uniref:Folic acid synthesis protein FOL1 n=1 Tax=Dispira parvispora TaxID=1520584 RepID=A0A9W8AVT5_9FUNG|nr:trifunctional dihydropteroate synthetase [Dispira parvispora]
MDQSRDKIIIRNLTVRNIIGVDSWERIKRQPIVISVTVDTPSIERAASNDTVADTIHYGILCKQITEFSEQSAFKSVEALAIGILQLCFQHPRCLRVRVKVEKPRALLHAKSAGVEIMRQKDHVDTSPSDPSLAQPQHEYPHPHQDCIFVRDLRLSTVVGVNPWERESTQVVVLTLRLWVHLDTTATTVHDYVPLQHNYRTIVRTVSEYVEQSSFKTVEALASAVARVSILKCCVEKITVQVEKPSALSFAEGAGVEITRTRQSLAEVDHLTQSLSQLSSDDLSELPEEDTRANREAALALYTRKYSLSQVQPPELPVLPHHAILALGSNMGNPVHYIHATLTELQSHPHIKVTNTSFLYRTAPMYLTDQNRFLNCACKIQTSLTPEQLLPTLKAIEVKMGRSLDPAHYVKNGPRPMDLDILFYDRVVLTTESLTIPHPRIAERLFVLFPLCDIAKHVEHPTLFKTCEQLLKLRCHQESPHGAIERVFPLHDQVWSWEERTYLMGILNCTPDSFSDGGRWLDIEEATKHAQNMVNDGADMVDVGGMSTRPGSEEISEDEEIGRVVPVLEKLRDRLFAAPLSIDTFRSRVAEAAIKAGASFINDISGGTRDPAILQVAAKYQVPYCLMHMRGNSQTMMSLTQYADGPGNVIKVIAAELQAAVHRALQAGIYRWNIIVDPGVGFAKTAQQDMEILRDLRQLTNPQSSPIASFPTLVGTSRKKFIGKYTGRTVPEERKWGTAATCAAAIAGGCNILRIHDVKEMRDVIKISDGVWRTQN